MARKPLVLLHGMLAKASVWRPFLDLLGDGVSARQVELPGHGLAPEWDQDRDYMDQTLEHLREEMPSEPAPLIGHSFGAVAALRYAVERPYGVSSLVLVEPVFFAAARGRYAQERVRREFDSVERRIRSSEFATAAKEFHALWGDGTPWGQLSFTQRSYIMDRMRYVAASARDTWDDPKGILAPGRLEDLPMPVTFVDGGESHPVMAEIIDSIGDRIPDAEWVTVAEAGHMLPLTHPEGLVEAVKGRLFVEPKD